MSKKYTRYSIPTTNGTLDTDPEEGKAQELLPGSFFANRLGMRSRFWKTMRTRSFLFSSPWLLAAAAGLLIVIVVTFAFHNLRLEERLMTDAMLQKAATLMRVVHSGARSSHFNDLRKDHWSVSPWTDHVQRVIDHLGEDPELYFVSLIDEKGKIIAHSNHARIGVVEALPVQTEQLQFMDKQPRLNHRIHSTADSGRIFEAIRPFTPFFPTLTPPPIRPMWERRQDSIGAWFQDPESRRPPFHRSPKMSSARVQYYVVVGLEMKEFDRTLARLRMQIFMLSLAMLLVGLGGWFSLLTVQGFRISQKTLNDVQAFTSLLITKLPVGIIAVDTSGRIATWNGAVSQLIGIEKEVVLRKHPKEVLPVQLATFFSTDATISRDQTDIQTENNVRLFLNNRRYELLCHVLTITDSEQKYMGKVLLISDVTEIKSLEQRMRESERLAAIGRMAGGVAHEVRNPLSSIKGLALLLKNKFPVGSKEQNTADLLIQETERMNRTITEMLSFTRPSTLRLAPVNLAALLEKSVDLIRTEATDNQIVVHLDVQPELPPVPVDTDRIQQVVMNVLLNASQAMEDGGVLTVRLVSTDDHRGVELRISDTGAGVSSDSLPQVFYPYFTTKPNGTGIGLAISQKIIADHGGTIDLESEPGTGTTVTIHLPVSRSNSTI